jgi:glycyl-tRNA synthetase beta chain
MPGAGTKAQGPDIGIPSAGNYESVLERAGILVDPTKRREAIVRGIEKVLEPGEEVVPDDELLDETVGIVETPKPVRCEFRIEYLSLPSIVVATALKKHQRCFSVRQAEPAPHFKMILPYFVAVTNTPTSDEEQVRAWYEKAAESRLKDAQFFIDEDLKVGLEGYLAQERNVTWIEGLGTLADKTERLAELSVLLAGAVPNGVIDPMALEQAARFCKADLLTNLVREKEYTSLQGMIGGYYASRTRGLLPRAVGAIAEHYAPRTSGDALPTATSEGALLSIADKLDNLCAAFVTGSIPTGSADPFALRRQTAGLLAIVVDRGWRFDLRALLGRTLELLAKPHDAKLLDQLCAFVRERLSLLLAEQGVKYDVANAVLEVAWQDPTDARQRCQALAQFRSTEEFEKLIIGQKRVVNILKGVDARLSVDEKMLQDKSEGALFDAARALDPKLAEAIAGQDYARAFKLLLSLRAVIDTFFDDVMVMCDDLDLSANRLALLAYVKSLFRRVADLSQIVVEGKQ